MNLKLGLLFLFLCCFTAINCWVELDIAGNDLGHSNPQFVKPSDDCEEGMGGRGGRGGRRGKGRHKRRRRNRGRANNDVNDFAQNMDNKAPKGRNGGGKPDIDPDNYDPKNPPGKEVNEVTQEPKMRMIKKENEPVGQEKVERQPLDVTEDMEFVDMDPKTSIKIETYTVPYEESVVKYKTVTRKIVYIQRRRKVKRTVNKPVLVIKRKVVNEKQVFERIVPKVIETREIINKPEVEEKVIEGPMEEMGGPKPPEDEPEDCEPVEQPGGGGGYGGGGDYGGGGGGFEAGAYGNGNLNAGGGAAVDVGAGSAGINVGFDFASALNAGIGAAFGRGQGSPNMRSFGGQMTTPCPPGMVDNGLGGGGSVGASSHLNAYGQPTLTFR